LAEEAAAQVLTSRQLADRWGLSIWTLAAWRQADKGPKPTWLARNFPMYPLSEVEKFERETGRRPV
jgi:hypothetical protein